jgi:hypothetical protein
MQATIASAQLRQSAATRSPGLTTDRSQYGPDRDYDARRLASLRAALVFLQLEPRARELQLLHRWLDNWGLSRWLLNLAECGGREGSLYACSS